MFSWWWFGWYVANFGYCSVCDLSQALQGASLAEESVHLQVYGGIPSTSAAGNVWSLAQVNGAEGQMPAKFCRAQALLKSVMLNGICSTGAVFNLHGIFCMCV